MSHSPSRAHGHRVIAALVVVLAAAGLVVSGAPAGAGTEEDAKAVQQVIVDLVAAFNSKEFQASTFEERGEMIRRLYHFESDRRRGDRFMSFGPLTHPVARGAAEHLANVNTNFEWFLGQGYGYGLRIDEMQTLVDQNLAVAHVVSRNWFTNKEGVAFAPQLGRGTVVLRKLDDRWGIVAVHGSMAELADPAQEGMALDSCLDCPVEARWYGMSDKTVLHQTPRIESLESLVTRIQQVNPRFRPPASLSEALRVREEARSQAKLALARRGEQQRGEEPMGEEGER